MGKGGREKEQMSDPFCLLQWISEEKLSGRQHPGKQPGRDGTVAEQCLKTRQLHPTSQGHVPCGRAPLCIVAKRAWASNKNTEAKGGNKRERG